MKVLPLGLFALFSIASAFAKVSELPEHTDNFLVTYCLDCHDEESRKGGINLELFEIDWTDPNSAPTWGKVFDVLQRGEMPPAKKNQPTEGDKLATIKWLEQTLLENDKPGGTILRRLSKEEYEKSVSNLLKIPFTVPSGFPSDSPSHGFDNHGGELVLSPPLMAQYLEIATSAADQVLPPKGEPRKVQKKSSLISPAEFTLNFTTGHVVDGVLRMVTSSDPLAAVRFGQTASKPERQAFTK